MRSTSVRRLIPCKCIQPVKIPALGARMKQPEGFDGMKATTWRRWITLAGGALALSLLWQPALASQPDVAIGPGLPEGLPDLPGLGETMQRHFGSGIALSGFDPIGYHLTGRPTPGRPEFEALHRGFVWRFASAANRAAFLAAPDIYAPAFEGFDPTGIAAGHAVETSPAQFAIVAGRLYLFRTAANREQFLKDRGLLGQAIAHWGEVARAILR